MIRVIAIDPGVKNPAFAILAKDASGWRLLESKRCASVSELCYFLHVAYRETDSLSIVCVESVAWSAFAGSGHGNNSASIIECVGVARMLAELELARLEIVSPNSWRKHITGNGRVSKKGVHLALPSLFPAKALKGLTADELDAIAIGITGYAQTAKRMLENLKGDRDE